MRGDDMLVNELVKLSGVSARTLRYYDEIGLLKPSKIEQNGYRKYSQNDIDRLQQILFYRELDFKLEEIKTLMGHPNFKIKEALKDQYELLQEKRNYIDKLLETIDQTIKMMEGELNMTNNQKFEVFQNKLIEENEQKFGEEIREKYGEEQVEASNKRLKNMSEDQFKAMQQLEVQLLNRLKEAMELNDATSEVAMEAAELHKRWLCFSWAKYSKEAHVGLAQMYLHDDRFIAYYDERIGKGATQFLHDVIVAYAANK